LEMHPQGLPFSLNVTPTVAEAVSMAEVVHAVHELDMVEAVEPETATKVGAPIANLTAMLPMHTGSGNALRREKTTEETTEETTNAFASSAGSQVMAKSIASPTNVYRSGGR
jgi:hypothetical protein